ncbi:MAG: ribulose-phosphate 3-epimerase [Saprospiraceae bacterium]
MKPHLLAPSLLAADFTNLRAAVDLVDQGPADWLHLDVMDGRFVPNISFGMSIIAQLRPLTEKPFDVHLMIEQPENYVAEFRAAGADIITVHAEVSPHLHRTVQLIKASGAKAGVALNPHTPVSILENIIEDLDLVLIMSVNPGFGGQQFIYHTIPKIRQLRDLITVRNASALIEIDGGVGMQNAQKILQAGADVLVAGSSVFKSADPTRAMQELKGFERNPIYV